jgi:hypothetical protein
MGETVRGLGAMSLGGLTTADVRRAAMNQSPGTPSNHAEMPKRLFDRLTLFGRAWLDVTISTGPVRPPQRRYAMKLLNMEDPPRLRDEAVVTLHELLNLGVRRHFLPSTIVPSYTREPMMLA